MARHTHRGIAKFHRPSRRSLRSASTADAPALARGSCWLNNARTGAARRGLTMPSRTSRSSLPPFSGSMLLTFFIPYEWFDPTAIQGQSAMARAGRSQRANRGLAQCSAGVMSVCAKSSPLNQQWLVHRTRQGIGKAVAKVQPCGMPAATIEVPMGFACDSCLGLSHRLDNELGLPDEIVKAAANDLVTACIDDDWGFDEIGRRDAAVRCGFNRSRTACPSGSSRRIAISADVSMITAAGRAYHRGGRRDRLFETGLSAAPHNLCRSPTSGRPDLSPRPGADGRVVRGLLL